MPEARRRRRGEPLPIDGTVVVVGGSLAGIRAVETLRDNGFRGPLHLVGEEDHLPYDRPPLSKQVLAGTWEPDHTVLADEEKLRTLGVEFRRGRRGASLDAERRVVEVDDGTRLVGDGVVVATGSSPRRLPVGDESQSVMVLRTVDDSLQLRRRVTERAGARVVIVGAGFIGSEVASTCHDLGADVHVVEALDTPLEPVLGREIGAACAALHREHGVALHTGVAVASLGLPADAATVGSPDALPPAAPGSDAVRVELNDGSTLTADVVVVGIGVAPNTGWLTGSGLDIDDGVRCDEALFAAPGVVAAGDVARWFHEGVDEELRIEHWQVAAEEGVAAARSLLAGTSAESFTPVPYFWSDQYGVRLQMLGRPRPDDRVEIVDGSLESHRFVALYGRGRQFTGALAISRPRQLMAYRPLLARQAPWDEALALSRA
jgi:3-phenylpropionate/trans-cinnamate dioxygenase ferredoxin reductase component